MCDIKEIMPPTSATTLDSDECKRIKGGIATLKNDLEEELGKMIEQYEIADVNPNNEPGLAPGDSLADDMMDTAMRLAALCERIDNACSCD